METAKVDIQKLQLLNDRISQCFDALNQVRLSVHGLSHTTGQTGIGAIGQQGFGAPMGFMGVNPFQQTAFQSPYQQNPYLAQGFGQPTPWASPIPGLSHTTFNPLATGQFNPLAQQINPLAQQIGGVSPFVNPYVNPYIGQIPSPYGGLSHTSPVDLESYRRPLWADPYLAVKVAQTFPFVQLPISPV